MIHAIYGLAIFSPYRPDLFIINENVLLIDILSAAYGSSIKDDRELSA